MINAKNTTVKRLVRKGKKTGIVDAEDILENIETLQEAGINTKDMISHLSSIGISVKIQNATGKEAGKVAALAKKIAEDASKLDDPVRMYLREIGKVPLLTAADEKRLSKNIENWRHIEEIKEEFKSVNDEEPSIGQIIAELVNQLRNDIEIFNYLQKTLKIKVNTFAELVDDITFRSTMDGTLDEVIQMRIKRKFKIDPIKAKNIMYSISTITSLLEPELIEWMAQNSKSNALARPST